MSGRENFIKYIADNLGTWKARHESLDVAMAAFHVETGKLFSSTPALDLVEWLDWHVGASGVPDMAPISQARADVIELVGMAAAADPHFSPQSTITDLMVWSWSKVKQAEKLAADAAAVAPAPDEPRPPV